MALMLDDMRAEFARFLAGDPAARFRMDAALAAARQSVANALPLITAASEGVRRQEGSPT